MRACKILALTLLTLFLLTGCLAEISKSKLTRKPVIILPPGTLSKDEITQLFSGKTVESETGSGRTSLTYYNPNGELKQLQYNEHRVGHWRIRDDARICLQLADKTEKCRIIVKQNGIYKKFIVKKNNRHRHVITYHSFRPGNQLGW